MMVLAGLLLFDEQAGDDIGRMSVMGRMSSFF
jgi:hypothetical protein